MHKIQLSLGALLLGTSSLLQAADDALGPIIVTATRTAQTADETLASVTVITRQDIQDSHSDTVMQLLQSRSVGLDVSRNGGPGATTNIFLRGTEGDHVLVLVDGVRVASVTSGSFNWASLSPEQIERIEIVRGPNSTLYGSEAIGGVIQIFTRKGKGPHAALTAGSYGTRKASVGTGGELGKGSYHINVQHQQDEGFSTTNPRYYAYESDHDSYRNSSVTTGFALPLGTSTNLGLDLFHSASRSEYDNSVPDAYADSRNSGANLTLDWQASDFWQQHFSLNASQDRYESHDSWPADITTRRRGFTWQNDVQVNDASLFTAGYEHQVDKGEIKGSYDEKLDNNAGYLQYQWSGERYDLLLGARSDHHSEYGRNNTGRLTVGSRLGGGRIYAGIANAFKAPTFNELYYPYYGNPAIEPEKSTTAELGYRIGGLQASLYRTRITNLIQSDPLTWQAVNVGKALIKGLELSYAHPLGEWQLDSGLTLQSAKDEASGDRLLRRAEKKLFFTARGPINDRTRVGIETSYTGPRMDYGNVELNAYTLLNLTADYRLAKQWSLGGRIENLLDEDYQLADGYNTPGASAYLTVSYTQ